MKKLATFVLVLMLAPTARAARVRQSPVLGITEQSGVVLSSTVASAAGAAVSIGIPAYAPSGTNVGAGAGTRWHLYQVDAWCSAGASNGFSVSDGGTVTFRALQGVVTSTTPYSKTWNPPLTSNVFNSSMTVNMLGCSLSGIGNLNVQADNW